jgi:hypothetical protein
MNPEFYSITSVFVPSNNVIHREEEDFPSLCHLLYGTSSETASNITAMNEDSYRSDMPLGLKLDINQLAHEMNGGLDERSSNHNYLNRQYVQEDQRHYHLQQHHQVRRHRPSQNLHQQRQPVIPTPQITSSQPVVTLPRKRSRAHATSSSTDPLEFIVEEPAKKKCRNKEFLTVMKDNNGSRNRKVFSYYWNQNNSK